MPEAAASAPGPAIGGFLGMELPAVSAGGFQRHWQLPGIAQAYTNARSALQALLEVLPVTAVWLPAYLCPEFGAVVPPARRRFYPVGERLSPDVAFLEREVAAGDLVLAVDYFGRPPQAAFVDFVAARPDLLFVEDCAQAIATGRAAWGDWQLYSPRKLIGVPDGGMLVARSPRAAALPISDAEPAGFAEAVERSRAQWLRYEDVAEDANDVWHALHQAKEAGMGLSRQRISRLAWDLMGCLDVAAIGAARQRNFAILAALLPDLALIDDAAVDFVPLGFPVRLPAPRRAAVRARLIQERIFPAIHWQHLLAPAAQFPFEHGLAATLLTLPCDQRYTAAQMERVAAALRQAMA